jgi:hypothetical protein
MLISKTSSFPSRKVLKKKKKFTASSSTRTVSIMGIIIAVAAVFEIHIEMNIVTKNRPNVSLKMKDDMIYFA